MSRVRSKDTGPELRVRRLTHLSGFRYRLHDAKLPGKPDLVFASRKKVVFVHGCFWHRHPGCKLARLPKSRLEFWKPKLEANRRRDEMVRQQLEQLGWFVLVVWECETSDSAMLQRNIARFLNGRTNAGC